MSGRPCLVCGSPLHDLLEHDDPDVLMQAAVRAGRARRHGDAKRLRARASYLYGERLLARLRAKAAS